MYRHRLTILESTRQHPELRTFKCRTELMKANPDFRRYFNLIKAKVGLLNPWAGNVLRQSFPRFLSKPYRFTGVGSVLVGGRWNVRKLMPAIYASRNPDTLHAEMHARAHRYGFKLE